MKKQSMMANEYEQHMNKHERKNAKNKRKEKKIVTFRKRLHTKNIVVFWLTEKNDEREMNLIAHSPYHTHTVWLQWVRKPW